MSSQSLKRMVHNTAPTEPVAYRKHRTCDRKKVYSSEAAGWGAVRSIKSNGNDAFPDFELRPYKCQFCGCIHVGHSNLPRTSEERMRRGDVGDETTKLLVEVIATHITLSAGSSASL